MYTLYMRERLTKTTTTHCYIIILHFTLLYIQDFGGGTLGHRPTINLLTFIRGRRSHAFLASIILYATSSVSPYMYISWPIISRRIFQKQRPKVIYVYRYLYGFAVASLEQSWSAPARAFIYSPLT